MVLGFLVFFFSLIKLKSSLKNELKKKSGLDQLEAVYLIAK